MNHTSAVTACVLIIGNEILSGKTQDTNLQFLGTELAALGIRLVEARVLRDDRETIASVLNECRQRYTYVFTTGGIGPTHDDITAESVAYAFGCELVRNEEAVTRLTQTGRELTPARLKMAMIPAGATLVDNPVSHAPGFRLENVFVLAGIPRIAQAMFESARGELTAGPPIHSASLDVFASEGDIAAPLTAIADAHPEVEIGSYPFQRDGRYGASLVVRGTDQDAIESVIREIAAAMAKLGA